MSDESDDSDNTKSKITATLGDLSLTVEGADEEWVEEQFEQQWQDRLNEASEMKQAIRHGDVSAQ